MNPPAKAAEKIHLVFSGGAVEAQARLEVALELSGLLWLDDGNELVDATPVSPWTDVIQRTEATNTGANRPTGQLNAGTGRIAVLGNGSDQDLDFGSTLAIGELFVAFLFEDPLTSTVVLMGGPNGSDRILLNTNGSVVFRAGGGGSATIAAAGTILADTPSMLVIQRDASDDITCRLDGVDVTDGTPSMSGTFDASHLMSQGNGNHMVGPLHSVIYNPVDDLAGKEDLIEALWNQSHNDLVTLP